MPIIHNLAPVSESLFKGNLLITSDDDNTINLMDGFSGKGSISISGTGNVLDFHEDTIMNGEVKIKGSGNKLILGKGAVVRGKIIITGSNQLVSIGDGTTFQSVYILCQEGCNVTIGRQCMLSRSIEIRTTDAHSVIDVNSGHRINKPSSVEIGEHVWIGVGAIISKGSVISDDSIVGARSFVNGIFKSPNVIIAGSPAKIVKTGVTWHRGRKSKFTPDEINSWKK